MTASETSSPYTNRSWVPISPDLDHDDSLMLQFLTSVRIWGMAFYENSESGQQVSMQPSWPEQGEEMNFAFKLAIDTLSRGHGRLAGRVLRKAFLLVEEMLMLGGPALVWNMLEIMHYMLTHQQPDLFQRLLAHLLALIEGKMSSNHPLTVILRGLRALSINVWSASVESSLSPSSLHRRHTTNVFHHHANGVSSVLERAWMLNAELLFDHFDDRLFQLYLRVHWDSCSLQPPIAIKAATKLWLSRILLPQVRRVTVKPHLARATAELLAPEEDGKLQHLLAVPMNNKLPESYEGHRLTTIAALKAYAVSILSKDASSESDNETLLRILASLVTAKIMNEWPGADDLRNVQPSKTEFTVSRGKAGNLACAIKTLMYLQLEVGRTRLEAASDPIVQLRSIVALREYAAIDNDPRLLRDTWLLEDALLAAGEYQEADEVKARAHRLLEEFIQEIPVDCV